MVKVGLAVSLVTALAGRKDLPEGVIATVSLRGVDQPVTLAAGVAESAQPGLPIDGFVGVAGRSVECFDQLPAAGALETPRDTSASPNGVDWRVRMRQIAPSITLWQVGGSNGFALLDYVVGVALRPTMSDECWRDHEFLNPREECGRI
jgi:hypothetical protein